MPQNGVVVEPALGLEGEDSGCYPWESVHGRFTRAERHSSQEASRVAMPRPYRSGSVIVCCFASPGQREIEADRVAERDTVVAQAG